MTEKQQDPNENQDVGLYEKLAQRAEKLLASGRKNFDEAMKKASEEVASAGDYTREQVDKVTQFVKRDLKHTSEHASKAGHFFKEAVSPDRIAAGAQSVFARILSASAETLSEWAAKSQQNVEFKTGEITSAGTLTCKSCGEEIYMKKTGRIPPCPNCYHPHFRKSY